MVEVTYQEVRPELIEDLQFMGTLDLRGIAPSFHGPRKDVQVWFGVTVCWKLASLTVILFEPIQLRGRLGF